MLEDDRRNRIHDVLHWAGNSHRCSFQLQADENVSVDDFSLNLWIKLDQTRVAHFAGLPRKLI